MKAKQLTKKDVKELDKDLRLFSLGVAVGIVSNMVIDGSNSLVERYLPNYITIIFGFEIIFGLIVLFYVLDKIKEILKQTEDILR